MHRAICLVILLMGIHCGNSSEAGPDMSPGTAGRMPGLGAVCSSDGWCWENPLPSGDDRYGVWGTDANNVWAVGGGIWKWDGTAWATQATGGGSAVWGLDANNIWVVGGGIMKRDRASSRNG